MYGKRRVHTQQPASPRETASRLGKPYRLSWGPVTEIQVDLDAETLRTRPEAQSEQQKSSCADEFSERLGDLFSSHVQQLQTVLAIAGCAQSRLK